MSNPGGDAQLIAGLAAGDESALAALYDRHGALMYALAFRILNDHEDAEEAVMTAFTQAWRGARAWSGERGSVSSWLVVLARSRALDRLRARKRRLQAESRAATEGDGVPAMAQPAAPADAGLDGPETGARIRSALGELPDAQRRCIELAYFEGLSQSEIAERLAEPLGTVKTRIRLAMGKLRDLLRPLARELSA